jgi:hypothetical protein
MWEKILVLSVVTVYNHLQGVFRVWSNPAPATELACLEDLCVWLIAIVSITIPISVVEV